MTKFLIAWCLLLASLGTVSAQTSTWKMVDGKITTAWASEVNPNSILPEYPRPQMVRDTWINLNGLWDYAIAPKGDASATNYEGKILVPFAIESALSGVGKTLGADKKLWYKRTMTLPVTFKGKSTLLHFGAVDWECDVFVNGQKVGTHAGGYDPFFFDVTGALKKSGAQEIVVSVWDPSDNGPQPRGKQIEKPHAIWYTPVSGIWQTVWMEAVPQTFLQSVKQVPDFDQSLLNVTTIIQGIQPGDLVNVSVFDGTQKVAEAQGPTGAQVKIPDAKSWSPKNPFLYDVKIAVVRKGKVIDEVKSYFGMRKISMDKDANGIQRMLLNNEFLFQYGPLDQGWWPDGLYTAPTDKALLFDIEKTKEMGFNMIRKHVKVEPARWYYHCDRIGILVWQDMPSGDMGNRWENRPGVYGLGTEKDRTPESETIYKKEWKSIIDATSNFPSVVVWVPFNEAWGQFKTEEIVKWTMSYDPSRLVNAASGGNFVQEGHIFDLHNYPEPAMPTPDLFGAKQILVLGEFGGLGLPLEGHTWQEKNNWGYQSFTSKEELFKKYESFIKMFPTLIDKGLSAAVYTQTTDVEIETNGLMSYDRKVVKFPEAKLKALHDELTSKKP